MHHLLSTIHTACVQRYLEINCAVYILKHIYWQYTYIKLIRSVIIETMPLSTGTNLVNPVFKKQTTWLAFWYVEINMVMQWQQFPYLNHLDSDSCSSNSLKQRTRSAKVKIMWRYSNGSCDLPIHHRLSASVLLLWVMIIYHINVVFGWNIAS